MDFGAILNNVKNAIGNAIGTAVGNYNRDNPSVLGNLLTHQPNWNQNIPRFGGYVSPLPQNPAPKPSFISPLPQNNPIQRVLGAQAYAAPKATPTPTPSPNPTSAPTPTYMPSSLQDILDRGLHKYPNIGPVASEAGAFAKAGENLPDPFLPAIISLIETHGGRDITRGQNNIYNMNANSGGVSYPNLQDAIAGGDGHQGFAGILQNAAYAKYRKTGNLADFFAHYSPPSENAPLADQVSRYKQIKQSYFTP